ncbi:MAG: hypothetical protein M3296_02295 [Actinomycetota bacterium]|nr:hypothetical protein [Actinomycetota bacterium]
MIAPLAVGTVVTVLALIGLAIGLVVLFVVIGLLTKVLTPLRKILRDVQSAQTATMLDQGVKGADQLARTRQLAEGVPDLAVAYMQKLGLAVDTNPRAQTFPERGPNQQGGRG